MEKKFRLDQRGSFQTSPPPQDAGTPIQGKGKVGVGLGFPNATSTTIPTNIPPEFIMSSNLTGPSLLIGQQSGLSLTLPAMSSSFFSSAALTPIPQPSPPGASPSTSLKHDLQNSLSSLFSSFKKNSKRNPPLESLSIIKIDPTSSKSTIC